VVDPTDDIGVLRHDGVVRLGRHLLQDVSVVRVNEERIVDGADMNAPLGECKDDPNRDQPVQHEDDLGTHGRAGLFQLVQPALNAGLPHPLAVAVAREPDRTGQLLVHVERRGVVLVAIGSGEDRELAVLDVSLPVAANRFLIGTEEREGRVEDAGQLLREAEDSIHLLIGGQVLTDVVEQDRVDFGQLLPVFAEVPLTEGILGHVRELAGDRTPATPIHAGGDAALGDALESIEAVDPEVTDHVLHTTGEPIVCRDELVGIDVDEIVMPRASFSCRDQSHALSHEVSGDGVASGSGFPCLEPATCSSQLISTLLALLGEELLGIPVAVPRPRIPLGIVAESVGLLDVLPQELPAVLRQLLGGELEDAPQPPAVDRMHGTGIHTPRLIHPPGDQEEDRVSDAVEERSELVAALFLFRHQSRDLFVLVVVEDLVTILVRQTLPELLDVIPVLLVDDPRRVGEMLHGLLLLRGDLEIPPASDHRLELTIEGRRRAMSQTTLGSFPAVQLQPLHVLIEGDEDLSLNGLEIVHLKETRLLAIDLDGSGIEGEVIPELHEHRDGQLGHDPAFGLLVLQPPLELGLEEGVRIAADPVPQVLSHLELTHRVNSFCLF